MVGHIDIAQAIADIVGNGDGGGEPCGDVEDDVGGIGGRDGHRNDGQRSGQLDGFASTNGSPLPCEQGRAADGGVDGQLSHIAGGILFLV